MREWGVPNEDLTIDDKREEGTIRSRVATLATLNKRVVQVVHPHRLGQVPGLHERAGVAVVNGHRAVKRSCNNEGK